MPDFDLDAALSPQPTTCRRWTVNGSATVLHRRAHWNPDGDLNDLVETVTNQPGQRWYSHGLTPKDRCAYYLSSVVDWERVDDRYVLFRVTITVVSDEEDGITEARASDVAYTWWMEQRVRMFGGLRTGFEDMEMTDAAPWPYA